MRNRIANSRLNGTGFTSRVTCFFFLGLFFRPFKLRFQCQEKPINEPLAVLLCHPAVVVQVLLQVGECSLYLIVGVWHPLALRQLAGEEVRQIEVHAVHGGTQPLVSVRPLP